MVLKPPGRCFLDLSNVKGSFNLALWLDSYQIVGPVYIGVLRCILFQELKEQQESLCHRGER